MIWWIVKVKEPLMGVMDGNVQVMLNEDDTEPIAFLSPESAVSWAESVDFNLDDPSIYIVDRDTREVYDGRR